MASERVSEEIEDHCRELDRCNQRGDRMLSVFDLLMAGTLELDLAAYLMARITRGASFIVGAVPGGAGKTTVMCALLNFVPAEIELVAATPQALGEFSRPQAKRRRCFVCHEIGTGPYFAYLWGQDLRRYCGLADHGHLLATNLHADDIGEVREQLCRDNHVPTQHFNNFDLLVFLRVGGDFLYAERRISKVYDHEGTSPHRLIYDADCNPSLNLSDREHAPDSAYLQACRGFLEKNLAAQTRTIEQSRQNIVAFLREHA